MAGTTKAKEKKTPEPEQPLQEFKTVSELFPDQLNANVGTERGKRTIQHSLRELGAGRSVVIDRNGKIIAGNKTVENAKELGLDEIIVVKTDGKKLVAVQRIDLDLDTDAKARELAIADNRTGELNLAWAGDVLKELSNSLDLKPYFDEIELKRLFGSASSPSEFAEFDESVPTEHTCPKCGYRFSGGSTDDGE